MRYFTVNFTTDEGRRFPWDRVSHFPAKVLDGHTYVSPDESFGSYNRDERWPFRLQVATRLGVVDEAALKETLLDLCVEWDVPGQIECTGIREESFASCFGTFTGVSTRRVAEISRLLCAKEYFEVRQEPDFVEEERLEASLGFASEMELARKARCSNALCEELQRIEESRSVAAGALAGSEAFCGVAAAPAGGRGVGGALACASAETVAVGVGASRDVPGGVAGAFAPAVALGEGEGVAPSPLFTPAFYLVEAAGQRESRAATDVLVQALNRCGRLPSTTVLFMDLDRMSWNSSSQRSFRWFCECLNEGFMETLAGNSLVVRYGAFDGRDGFEPRCYKVLTRLLELAKGREDGVQLFVSIPPGRDDLRQRIANQLEVPLVELRRNPSAARGGASAEAVWSQLEALAREKGLAPDRRLREMLEQRCEDRSFDDVSQVFWEWRREKLTRQGFLAYEPIAQDFRRRQQSKKGGALERLEALVGLGPVKQQVRDLLARDAMNAELSRQGLPCVEFNRHMVFSGAPGTGKTEVARIYADILKEQRVLSEGRLIARAGTDLPGIDLDELFEAARGSMIFIDEAYALLGFDGTIARLIALMENYRDEVVVILAGYRDHMEALLRSNPGFRSRIGFHLDFPDYSPEEKLQIFQSMARAKGIDVPPRTLEAVRDVLARGGVRDDEGNARFVRNLFEDACGRQQVRLANERPAEGWTPQLLQTLEPQDVLGKATPAVAGPASARGQLEELIGLSEVKRLVNGQIDFMRAQKARRDRGMTAPFLPLHMAFAGNPGTGKTEVARLMGRILKEEGVLSVGDFFECGRQDLVGQAVGHTAPKVEALFRKAKGSVIFIDEAYSLCEGYNGFGDEAVAAIIDQMEKLRHDVVVILAGYPREIEQLLAMNPGFKSRVRCRLDFPDYSPEELCAIARLMARQRGFALTAGAQAAVARAVRGAGGEEGFGNARFVRNLLDDALVAQAVRLAAGDAGLDALSDEALTTLEAADFATAPTPGAIRRHPVGFRAA